MRDSLVDLASEEVDGWLEEVEAQRQATQYDVLARWDEIFVDLMLCLTTLAIPLLYVGGDSHGVNVTGYS